MNIRSKLLISFIPLVVIPIAITGYLAIHNAQSMSTESEKVSASVERLESSSSLAEEKITSIIESKTLLDYRFFSRHLRQNFELQISNLEKILKTLACSSLAESYVMTEDTAERKVTSAQLSSLFRNIITTYNLSDIHILSWDKRHRLHVMADNSPKASPWIPEEESGTEAGAGGSAIECASGGSDDAAAILTTVYFEKDIESGSSAPAMSLTCPLGYKKRTLSDSPAPGYLRLTIMVRELAEFIIAPNADFHGQIILTDGEKTILAHTRPGLVGTEFEPFNPELDDYHIVSHNMLNGLLHLHILIWREKISQSSVIVRTLSGAVHKGAVEARTTSLEIKRRIGHIEQQTMVVTLLALLIASSVVIYISRKISYPITQLAQVAIRVASGALEEETVAGKNSSWEIALLARNFDKMRLNLRDQISNLDQLVAERTQELEKANQALKESLDELHKTQDQLVQSGKMAALGNLVAGVAHEINTPVGIGVTGASLLHEKTTEVAEAYKSGQLKRSILEKYIRTATESSASILSNLSRASEFIQSFKQVAVDQSLEEKRRFKFKTYIDEVLLSLWPKYKRTKHTITVNCPDDLSFYSYPGVFMQIITNLVVNSLMHGFEGVEQGHICIEVTMENEVLHFRYNDDGKGMAEEQVAKIFDPFFTTKRARGGTGLGMHIVYNQVTQTLGGHIECSSRPGEGTVFDITIHLEEEDDVAKR